MESAGAVAAVPLQIAWGLLKKHMAARLDDEVGFEQLRQSLLGELESIKEDLTALRSRELKTALDHLESAYLIQQYYDPNDEVDNEVAVDPTAHARSVTAAGARAKWFFEESLRNARAAFGIVPDIDGRIVATKASIVAAYHIHCDEPDVAKRLCIKFLRDLFALPEATKLFDDLRDEQQPGRRTTVKLKHLLPGQKQKGQDACRAIAAVTDYVLSVAPHNLNDELARELGLWDGAKAHHNPWFVTAQQPSISLKKHGDTVSSLAMLKHRPITASPDKTMRVWGANIGTGESLLLRKIHAVPKDGFTALATGPETGDTVTVFAGHSSGHISAWSLDETNIRRESYKPKPCFWIAAHAHATDKLVYSAKQSSLFSVSFAESVISCWDASYDCSSTDEASSCRRHKFTLDGHQHPVTDLVLSDNLLFSGDRSGVLKVWLVSSELSACIQTITTEYEGGIVCIAAEKQVLFICSSSVTSLWTIPDKGPLTMLRTLDVDCTITCIAVNAEKLFLGSVNGPISCWDLRFAAPKNTDCVLRGHSATVTRLLLFRAMLISTSSDGTTRCWWLAG